LYLEKSMVPPSIEGTLNLCMDPVGAIIKDIRATSKYFMLN